MNDPTERFTDRAENYARFRPPYPKEAIALLEKEIGFSPAWRLADIGSGTGILTKMLLQHGNAVYGVEPNKPMRAHAESTLANFPKFKSVDGTAEATTLPNGGVEALFCAQSYHWFDPIKAKIEFKRILRPGGFAILMWNQRATHQSKFMEGYEAILKGFIAEYGAAQTQKRTEQDKIAGLYYPNKFKSYFLPHKVVHTWDSLIGLCLSASYFPLPTHPKHNATLEALRQLFEREQAQGKVMMHYRTEIYWGQPNFKPTQA